MTTWPWQILGGLLIVIGVGVWVAPWFLLSDPISQVDPFGYAMLVVLGMASASAGVLICLGDR